MSSEMYAGKKLRNYLFRTVLAMLNKIMFWEKFVSQHENIIITGFG